MALKLAWQQGLHHVNYRNVGIMSNVPRIIRAKSIVFQHLAICKAANMHALTPPKIRSGLIFTQLKV